MQSVRLIRHGESAANAGAATRDHASIALTEKGIEQARQVAQSIVRAPELIVVSPYLRAQATAQATAAVHPGVPVETWPIEEFTYLAPARCVDTTVAQRRAWVAQYWANADPASSDGDGAELFLAFIARAQSFLERLAAHPAREILGFSHGQFLNAVAWLIEHKPQRIDGNAMTAWREYEISHHVANGAGYLLSRECGDSPWHLTT